MKKYLNISAVFILVVIFCSQSEAKMVRQPVVAGQFYPENKKILEKEINEILTNIPTQKIAGKILGVVVPHAGYPYSGSTAGYAYKAVANKDYQTVILIGPTHYVFFDGAAVYSQGSWQTPLGEVPVDEELARSIINQNDQINDLPQMHRQEHSLEVQIPFLQKTLTNFKIVPIMLCEPSFELCEQLAKAIANAVKNKNVLLLASSDLYHGYSYTECKKTDSLTLSYLEKFDPKGLYQSLKQHKAQACGGYPIVVVMLASKLLGATHSKILHQTNSNDVIGEKGGYCVGYASAVFYKSESKSEKSTDNKESTTIELTPEEQRELIRIARTTIENYIRGQKVPEFTPLTEKLKEKYGVFVTLHKKGELRGCIGYVQGIKPLYQAVSEMAIASATEDPRFPKVTANELKDIDIEITVLTPLKRITDINEIQIGKHGLVIRRGGYQGLLLPQVATEQGWDRKTFLEHTCWKAGLPSDAWQDKNTEIYIFSGTIIHE